MSRGPQARAQRGVVLFIALIVLVAMSLAGIALMRSVDTNVLVAGNLAFRQTNTMYGDVGVEAASTTLVICASRQLAPFATTIMSLVGLTGQGRVGQ